MSSVRELHEKAMHFAHLALIAREQGDVVRAQDFARQGYDYELQAVQLVPDDSSSEPTRSILYNSVASLAYQCQELKESQRLILKGLNGNPTPRMRRKLEALYERVRFEMQLQSHHLVIDENVLSIALLGDAIGPGTIPYKEFSRRTDSVFTLLERGIERKSGGKYRKGGPSANMYKIYRPLLSFQEGSFIISIHFEYEESKQLLMLNTSEVIDDIVKGIEYINNSDEESLIQLIPEEAYRRSFIGLVKEMAPDGEQIDFVGFSSKNTFVNLTRLRQDIPLPLKTDYEQKETHYYENITVEGELDLLTSRGKEIIGLTTDNGHHHEVVVPEGIDDTLLLHFRQRVVVSGPYDSKKNIIYPTSIDLQ